MGDRLWVGIPPWYVIRPTRSTQPCIPPGSLNQVLSSVGWGKGGNATSVGRQVTLCDLICRVSSRSGEANCCRLLYFVLLFFTFLTLVIHCCRNHTNNFDWVLVDLLLVCSFAGQIVSCQDAVVGRSTGEATEGDHQQAKLVIC